MNATAPAVTTRARERWTGACKGACQPERGAGIANSSAASTSCGSSIPVGSLGSVTGPWCSPGSATAHAELLGGEHVVSGLVSGIWGLWPSARMIPDG